MRRVVITGLGIVSCLGNDKDTVTANLRANRPGIKFQPEYAEMVCAARLPALSTSISKN